MPIARKIVFEFLIIRGDEENISIEFFHRVKGLSLEEQSNKWVDLIFSILLLCINSRRLLYGENSIRIDLTPIYVLLFREVTIFIII